MQEPLVVGDKQVFCKRCHLNYTQRYEIRRGPRGGEKRKPISHDGFCTGPCVRQFGSGLEDCRYRKGHPEAIEAAAQAAAEKKRKWEEDEATCKQEKAQRKRMRQEEKEKEVKERARLLELKAKAKAPHNTRFSKYLAAKGVPARLVSSPPTAVTY